MLSHSRGFCGSKNLRYTEVIHSEKAERIVKFGCSKGIRAGIEKVMGFESLFLRYHTTWNIEYLNTESMLITTTFKRKVYKVYFNKYTTMPAANPSTLQATPVTVITNTNN